jgi:hypothetical protein
MAIAAVLFFASACAGAADGDAPPRLILIRTDVHGDYVWYDTERMEECQSHATEYNGYRCFPRFTRIEPGQLGYIDDECKNIVAWTAMERPNDRYVAVVSTVDEDVIDSFFGVLKTSEADDRYGVVSGECTRDKSAEAGACAEITSRLSPREFAPVNACGTGFVETRLSGNGGPEIVLCRECDYDCNAGGDPCGKFGDSCDFSGTPGICSTCCNGFTGELRCYPRND